SSAGSRCCRKLLLPPEVAASSHSAPSCGGPGYIVGANRRLTLFDLPARLDRPGGAILRRRAECLGMICPRCRAENGSGSRFCGQCGAPLSAVCDVCGSVNPPENRFCGQCAAPLVTT